MVKRLDPMDVLNKKGIFLQKFCGEKIHKAGWNVEEEFPVVLEFSTGKSHQIYESAGDIRANLVPKHREYKLTAIVECKHRFESHWIFFKAANFSRHSPKMLDLQYTPKADLSRRSSKGITSFYYADLELEKMNDCLLCNIGKEIPESTERKSKKYDSIYEACREVALATKSSAEEDRSELETYGTWLEGYTPPHNVYIPIVVTSATVDICEYDLQDFAKEKVVKDAAFSQVDWLAYDFPLPSYLRIAYKMHHPMDFTEMDKQTIFIVNFLKCTEFFELLKKYFKEWSDDILHEPEIY